MALLGLPVGVFRVMIQTESGLVSGFGERYWGPIPTQSRPLASKVMAQGFLTMGSRAKSET